MKLMKMPRWTHYGNCQPRTMRLSVEPLCPTHNVQRRQEPVYNSGNPHCKNRDDDFPACFNLLQSVCQSGSVECLPSSHSYMCFPPNPSYYSFICKKSPDEWRTKSLPPFSLLFIYLLILQKQQVSTNRQWLSQSVVFAFWTDRSVISPAEKTHAEVQRSTPFHLSVHVQNRGMERETKNCECFIFSGVGVLLQWSQGHWFDSRPLPATC